MNNADAIRFARDLHRAGKLQEAQTLYQRVLSTTPEHPQALHYLGLIMRERRQMPQALDLLRRAAAADPRAPEVHNNLATVLGAVGRAADALACVDAALRLRPDYVEAIVNRGLALDKLKRRDEALACFRRALELHPDHVAARLHLATAFARQGRVEEAADELRRVTAAAPRNPGPWMQLGNLCQRQARPDHAAAAFRRAIELKPDFAEAYNNLGNALKDLGELEAAIAALRKSVELKPDFAHAHWNLALALLLKGDFQSGWLEYEWREHLAEDKRQRRRFPQPVWHGSPPAGKTILLLTEQGLGDTIQFVRYAPLLTARGAKVLVECQPKLRPLLQTLAGVDRVVARGEPLPPFDTHARLLTLPCILGADRSNIPAAVPYLSAEPERAAEWKAKLAALAGGRLKVGIAWQGSKGYRGDAQRSVPLHHFAELAQCPGVALFCLQKGLGTEQVADAGVAVHQFDPPLDETTGAFVETAAVMANLDLVVTSDTSIAHLAGALGVPTWVALCFVPDWRWMAGGDDSPWYPTARLFRQPARGDWAGVFGRIAGELRALAGARAAAADPAGRPPAPDIRVPVSVGELFDKVTILEIKSQRLDDPDKLRNVRAELDALRAAARLVAASPEIDAIVGELRDVNARLWGTEDELRGCEGRQDFGAEFVALARSVYRDNDRRADLKRRLNDLSRSRVVEEKLYRPAHK